MARFFDMAKKDVRGFEPYARQIAGLFPDNPEVLEKIIEGLVHIARADGRMHDNELDYLRQVAAIFGLDDARFARAQAAAGEKIDPYQVLGLKPRRRRGHHQGHLAQAGAREPSRPHDRAGHAGRGDRSGQQRACRHQRRLRRRVPRAGHQVKPVDLAIALAVMLMWGLNFVFAKIGLQHWPPVFFVALRFACVAALLLPFVRLPQRQAAADRRAVGGAGDAAFSADVHRHEPDRCRHRRRRGAVAGAVRRLAGAFRLQGPAGLAQHRRHGAGLRRRAADRRRAAAGGAGDRRRAGGGRRLHVRHRQRPDEGAGRRRWQHAQCLDRACSPRRSCWSSRCCVESGQVEAAARR